jgi:hypothetical protein
MRRLIVLGLGLMLLTTACATAGTGSPTRRDDPAPPSGGNPTAPAGTRDAEIYTAVLRRYLTTPSENSFPGFEFPAVYVLTRTDPSAAKPIESGTTSPGFEIAAPDQQRIAAELRDVGNIRFIADRDEVIERVDACAQVRDGGILIVLAPPTGGADEVEVGIHGFVACLGATWLTYVVRHVAGSWTVTGTTGGIAIA